MQQETGSLGGGGLALWFTGLPGSGKSTLSVAVSRELEQRDGRLVTMLDGDVVRRILSRGVGFSRTERGDNVRRIGFAASLIVRHGGIAIIAAVSPYRDVRAEVRALVEAARGHFVEIYMDTPFSECIARDPKGMYAAALDGKLPLFTGVDDPYEKPLSPDLRIPTLRYNLAAAKELVLGFLDERHYLVKTGRVGIR